MSRNDYIEFERSLKDSLSSNINFLINIGSLDKLGANPKGALSELSLCAFINKYVNG